MKRLKTIFLSVAVALVGLAIIGFVFPSTQRVERSMVTTGKAEDVFARIATLKRWPEWTAWTTNRFPDMAMRFEGPEIGVGARMIATGKSSGDGTVKIQTADPARGITYVLDFNHGTQLFVGVIRCEKLGGDLRVTWSLDADLGQNPLKRWAGLAMDALMGGDMEKGLQNLKQAVESKP